MFYFTSHTFYLTSLFFYLASRISYLASRISYLACRIFISNLAWILKNHLELSHISYVPYRLPYIPQTFLEGQSNVSGWEKRSAVSFRRPYTASRTTTSLYVLSQLKR